MCVACVGNYACGIGWLRHRVGDAVCSYGRSVSIVGDSCGGDASDLDGVGDGMLVKTVALVASFVVV